MTTEDKELLLRDLCARLYTGTIVNYNNLEGCDYELSIRTLSNFPEESLKCYLRPMSSMTEEEENEYRAINCYEGLFPRNEDALDYVLSHHFDYRGLIEKSLAIIAPEDMYKTE